MVNAKHLATFIMGAAAGVALQKYLQTEEGEQALEELKTKAGELKIQAEEAIEKAPEYFEQLKTEGGAMLKDKFPDVEKLLQELLGKTQADATTQSPTA
jgi:hypothetical protein